jgi:hypothetical protein
MASNDRDWEDFLRRTEAPAQDRAFVFALIERIERESAARQRRRRQALAAAGLAIILTFTLLSPWDLRDQLGLLTDLLVALLVGIAVSELLGRLLPWPEAAGAPRPTD